MDWFVRDLNDKKCEEDQKCKERRFESDRKYEGGNSTQILPKYFCNEKATPMYNVIFALVWGIILSPWSRGVFWLIVSIVVYEILLYIFTKGDPKYWSVQTRCACICAAVLGFIIGRTSFNQNVLEEGI